MWHSDGIGLITRVMSYKLGSGKDYGKCYSWGSGGSACGESG